MKLVNKGEQGQAQESFYLDAQSFVRSTKEKALSKKVLFCLETP